jgi:diguanylate cyclase (GGDEF)-like protein
VVPLKVPFVAKDKTLLLWSAFTALGKVSVAVPGAKPDQFKKYNDTYGHQAGDEVLISVVQVLKQVFNRASDHVFRLGGEEFGVLFPVQQPEHVALLAEKTQQTLAERNIEHSGNLPHNQVTLSMGIMAIDPTLDYVTEEIYKYADEALYRAKDKGRNTFELVDMHNAPDVEFF